VSVASSVSRANSFRGGQPRELHLQEVDIVADRVKVAAGLIDLPQRERAIV
jgi:hypothetical protein